MAVLSVVTFLHLARLLVGCKLYLRPNALGATVILILPSFAFVEYESRRDADDAYHEMHNKRIGRDDLLKIEVSLTILRIVEPIALTHT